MNRTVEMPGLDDVATNDLPPVEHIWPYPAGCRPDNARALCGVTAYVDEAAPPDRPIGEGSPRLCGICREKGRALGLPV